MIRLAGGEACRSLSEGSYLFLLLPLSVALFNSVSLISLWALKPAGCGWRVGSCWDEGCCWDLLPCTGLAGLGGCAGASRLRFSSLTPPLSFLSFPLSFFCCAGVGDRELAEDTGLARSAYISSESALRTELLLEEALETEETLLTLKDLDFLEPDGETEAEEDRE